ncbi:MAG: type II toxin-antitoxin system Phd/YefM family antitoxin [Selenomonas bovis]|nr:type II toxin-antitoxin system Phd/YefM family antitoxin [Selenomonas bovis]
MQVMNATNFRQNMYQTMEQTVRYNEPVCITGKTGNAVLLSEEDYNDLVATLELCAVPGMQKKIENGMKTPLSECIPESEVHW